MKMTKSAFCLQINFISTLAYPSVSYWNKLEIPYHNSVFHNQTLTYFITSPSSSITTPANWPGSLIPCMPRVYQANSYLRAFTCLLTHLTPFSLQVSAEMPLPQIGLSWSGIVLPILPTLPTLHHFIISFSYLPTRNILRSEKKPSPSFSPLYPYGPQTMPGMWRNANISWINEWDKNLCNL